MGPDIDDRIQINMFVDPELTKHGQSPLPAVRETILREVVSAVATWQKLGQKLGMSAAELDSFADAFEHPERKAAQKLAG